MSIKLVFFKQANCGGCHSCTSFFKIKILAKKNLNQPILVIKRECFSENPREIVAKAFHENFHYLYGDLLKTREFYEHILVETDFVKIKHNADKYDNLDLKFSTCHIFKILTIKQWGGNPIFSREF